MRKKIKVLLMFTTLILSIVQNYSIGQNATSLDSLNWKKIQIDPDIKLQDINRIDKKENKTIKKIWYNSNIDMPIRKCTVSFKGSKINSMLNSKENFNIPDSKATPFIIYYQKGLTEKPQTGTWVNKDYFYANTDNPGDWDWHTLVVMTVFPLGFQIYFDDNYFKSRMFISGDEKISGFLIPTKEELFQNSNSEIVKGKLISFYDLAEIDHIQKRVFKNLNEIEIIIEYEYKITDTNTR